MDMDIYDIFSTALHQRLNLKRRSADTELSNLTHGLVYCIAHTRTLKFILDDVVDEIIQDCQIYYDMEAVKAFDSLKELSNLVCLYVREDERVYGSICQSIQRLRASYPTN
jgi:ABC-type dipeptide/oligopeptide/nickel transport system ATPase subunit